MSKVNYLLSNIDYDLGFNKNLISLLIKDIVKTSSLVVISSSFDDYRENDKKLKHIVNLFNNIDIKFNENIILDNRINKLELSSTVEKADMVILLDESPLEQIKNINDNKLINVIKEKELVLAIGYGSINMASHAILIRNTSYNINGTVCYDGLGLVNINIEPRFDFINIEHNKDIFSASIGSKIVCLTSNSFIRIEDKDIKYYDDYYVIEDGNLEQNPYPHDNINHLGTIPLETERLLLRKAIDKDVDDLFYIQLDPELRIYMGPTKLGTNIDREKYYFTKILENYSKNDFYRWTIVLKENNKVLGTIMLNIHDEKAKVAGIDYYLRKDYWNKGLMTEAASKVLEFAFDELDLNRIESSGSKNNPATYKVMEHIGLRYEGTRKQSYFYYYGGIQDLVMYGLTKKDYLKKIKK